MNTLRGALIGFGFIAEHGHAPAYASKSSPLEITAIVEPAVRRHAAARTLFPRARLYTDTEALFAREALDFIDICTPPSEHARVAKEAFARGLHVLSEKPLAMTSLEAKAMAAAALTSKRVLFPTHSYRHAPVVQTVRDLLARDRIGSVQMVTLDTYRTTHARGVPEWRPDWRREPRFSGGGILMDHGPHTSYLAFEWMGGRPSQVNAWAHSTERDGVEDDAVVAMTFPRGTVRAHLSWNAGMRRVLYTLHGDRGAIRVEDDEVELVVRDPSGVRTEKVLAPSEWANAGHGPWFEGVLRGFAKAVADEDWLGDEARDAVASMEVISAARASADRGGAAVALVNGAEPPHASEAAPPARARERAESVRT
jgi:predicted dehydrogenase